MEIRIRGLRTFLTTNPFGRKSRIQTMDMYECGCTLSKHSKSQMFKPEAIFPQQTRLLSTVPVLRVLSPIKEGRYDNSSPQEIWTDWLPI